MPDDEFQRCLQAFGHSLLAPGELTPLAREAIRARAAEVLATTLPREEGKEKYTPLQAALHRCVEPDELKELLGERAEQAHHLAVGRHGSEHHGSFAGCGADICRRVRQMLGR